MKSSIPTLLVFWLIAVTTSLNAQSSWVQLAALPEGGTVVDLAVDNTSRVYALTSHAGEIYYSSNNGVSWTMMPGTYKFSNPTDIEVDKTTNTLYVGTLSHGLFWTSNLGVTWLDNPFYVLQPSGTSAFINKTIRKTSSNIIVCNEPGAFNSSTMYRSTNAGATWSSATVNFGGVYSFAYLSNTNLLAGTENGVYVSNDDGQNWTGSNTGIWNLRVSSLLEKTSQSLVFAAVDFNTAANDSSGCGVYVSNNGGANWIKSSAGMTDCRITCLAMDPVTGDLYASYYNGVYRSVNNGQTWSPVNTGLGTNDYTSVVTNASGLFAASRKMGVAFSAAPSGGWALRNNGLTVSTIGDMEVKNATDVHVLDKSNSGVYNFNGTGWSVKNNGLPSAPAQKITRDHNGVLYASYVSDKYCLYKSTNQGTSWAPVTSLPMPPPASIYWAMCSAIKIDNNNNIYVLMEYSSQAAYVAPEVFRSTDNGLTWTNVYTLDVNSYFYLNDIDLASDSAVYLTVTDMTIQTQVLHSAAWGNTFTPLPNPVPSLSSMNFDLVVAPNDSLFLMQNNVLYKRNVALWDSVPSVWNYVFNIPSAKLYIDKLNGLYVVNINDGIYYSANTGASWNNISNGLPVFTPPLSASMTISLYDLQFDSANIPYALCTDFYTGGLAGIYSYVATNTLVTALSDRAASPEFGIYPNPASNSCVLKHATANKAALALEVFDAQGRVVRKYERGHFTEGAALTIDVSEFAPGLYMFKLEDAGKTFITKMIKE